MVFLLFSMIICQFSFQHAETTMSFHCLRCSLCFWLIYAQHHGNVGWITQMNGFSKTCNHQIFKFSVCSCCHFNIYIWRNKTHAWRCLLHINCIELVHFLMHLIQSTFRHTPCFWHREIYFASNMLTKHISNCLSNIAVVQWKSIV